MWGNVMPATTRREFISQSVSLLALGAAGLGVSDAFSAMGPNDKFDLVIKGGEAIDPTHYGPNRDGY